jgi:membrane-associated phospholipid phosphatase
VTLMAAGSPPRSDRACEATRTRRPALGAGVLLAVFGLVTWQVVADGPLVDCDRLVRDALPYNEPGVAHDMAYALSLVGGRVVSGIVLGLLALVVAYRSRRIRPLVTVIAAFVAVGVVGSALKTGFDRAAPGSGEGWVGAGGDSYPSGHAANAVVLWGVAAMLAAQVKPAHRRLIYQLATVPAVLAPVAMIYLNYHWVTDVLAGWCVGGILLCVLAMNRCSGPGSIGCGQTPADGRRRTSLLPLGAGPDPHHVAPPCPTRSTCRPAGSRRPVPGQAGKR